MKSRKSKVGKNPTKQSQVKKSQITESKSFWNNTRLHCLIIFGLAFGLYANTLGHDYTQDDAIVIYDNMFTTEGVSGIPGILKYDTFYGFFKTEGKAKLVSGGRYRPFTLIMFAIEWQLFGKNPFIGHLVNIIVYGLLGVCIYLFLMRLLGKGKPDKSIIIFALLAAILYTVHPIHTEAVANIKGRDEIMSMLGSIAAFYALLLYIDRKKIKYLIYGSICFFIALMSKENAITFLGIIPVGLMLFRKQSIPSSVKNTSSFLAVAALFLIIRFSVLGLDFGSAPNELMNNPFLKISNNSYVPFSLAEKTATICYTLGKYIQLTAFPHPLSHDYYPRAVDIMQWSNWKVLLSFLLYVTLIIVAFKTWKSNRIISFGILFYLLSLSIVSNIVFPIGTNMSERFLFMPSLGLIIPIAFLLNRLIKQENIKWILFSVICLALSTKTISRNNVWKDDFTLFTTDVKNQNKSAKLLNAAGGALTTTAAGMQKGEKRNEMLNQAVTYLNQAVKIHPAYRNAYLLLGNAYYYIGNYEQSIQSFDKSLSIDPDYADALKNLPIVLRDGGRHMGQTENNFKKAEEWLLRSYNLNASDYETCRLLGITYGIQGQGDKAIEYFQKAVELRPDIASNYSSLGTAYMNNGDTEKAREAFNKAVEIDPKALEHLRN